jgi:hypothetical protein
MNTYVITLSGYDRSATAYGETPGKAKYNFFMEVGDLFDSFAEFLRFIKSIRLVHKFRPCDLFGDAEQFGRMKECRDIPYVFMGMRVILKSGSRGNIKGTIVGSNDSMNLDICFDGTCYKQNCHPHYELIYLDNSGNIEAEF